MAESAGVLVGAARPGSPSGCALTIRFIEPWRYSMTSRERCRATGMKPIVWRRAPNAWGCEVAYSMNSMPSMPSGLLGSGLCSRTVIAVLSRSGDEQGAEIVARGAEVRQEARFHLPDGRVGGVHADVDRGHHGAGRAAHRNGDRSEEHTSELQSLRHLVCRLLLEK